MNRAAAICMIIGSSIWLTLASYDSLLYLQSILDYPLMDIAKIALYRIGWTLIPICFLIASIFLLTNKK